MARRRALVARKQPALALIWLGAWLQAGSVLVIVRRMKFRLLALLAAACLGATTSALAVVETKIVLIAGSPSHGPGEHEHHAGCQLLAKKLN